MATAKVVFATITGNNEDVADIVAQELEKKGVEVSVEEISQADPEDFADVDICVVCPYTMTKERFLMKVLIFTMILKMSI